MKGVRKFPRQIVLYASLFSASHWEYSGLAQQRNPNPQVQNRLQFLLTAFMFMGTRSSMPSGRR